MAQWISQTEVQSSPVRAPSTTAVAVPHQRRFEGRDQSKIRGSSVMDSGDLFDVVSVMVAGVFGVVEFAADMLPPHRARSTFVGRRRTVGRLGRIPLCAAFRRSRAVVFVDPRACSSR